MKLRTSAATALAATAAVLAMGAAPAMAATTHTAATLKPTTLSLSANVTWAKYGQWATLTAHLGPTAANRTVEIDGAGWGAGSWVLKKANVDRNGNLVAYAKMSRNTTFTAKFAGDSKDAAASAKRVVYSSAGVTSRMFGYYGTSGAYHLYHYNTLAGNKGKPVFGGQVLQNKGGESVNLTWQVYYHGAWRTANSGGFQLDKQYSAFSVWFQDVPQFKGLNERVSFSYAGDGVNTGANSGWSYFRVS
ncbi:hypothetical protein [Streptacidiphilus rugosus]|uniref:hypothetical protein n=1 Tax=Streptacidiphilus rugosus TaxID=405783 RepID=UPI00056B4497|nr:hypothetical protein [Streptacidiphilus rugosus]